MKRLAALLACCALAGCGSPSADLFLVKRTGADAKANLTLLVSDGGTVTCNGTEHEISGDLLLRARELERQLSEQAELNLALEPGPNAVLSYKVEMQAGHDRLLGHLAPAPALVHRSDGLHQGRLRERLRHRSHLTQNPLALAGAVRYLYPQMHQHVPDH